MKRKTSTLMRMQRVTSVGPSASSSPLDPATEIATILAELSPRGRATLLAYARTVRDDERRRGARPPLISLSMRDFVARVLEVANDAVTGVYAGNKVFVAALFKMFEDRGEASGCKIAEFKDRLFMAQRAGLLALERCESLDRLDATTVLASEIRHVGAVYHLVVRSALR